jgi:hypothetical protein
MAQQEVGEPAAGDVGAKASGATGGRDEAHGAELDRPLL